MKEFDAELRTIEITILGIGKRSVSIASESTQKKLFTPDGKYVSRGAMMFDTFTYFYVPDEMMDVSNEELREYVEKHCS